METTKFKVLRGFCLGGDRGDVFPGDEIELGKVEAKLYGAQGRVVPVSADEKQERKIQTRGNSAK